jgi:hypothetical protein
MRGVAAVGGRGPRAMTAVPHPVIAGPIRDVTMNSAPLSCTRSSMSEAEAPPRPGITVRLGPATRGRVQRIAAFEHRSISGYVQMLIERDLQARDEAERVIHVFVAPELANERPGTLPREKGKLLRSMRNVPGHY